MADELVKRLRNPTYYTHPTTEDGRLAADRIEQLVATNKQLTAERDRLRAALEDIADHDTGATAGLAYTAKIALKGDSND